jgi:alpha-tubulin suppressor-like RCC1 family protein
VVLVCEWDAQNGECGPVIAGFSRSLGTASEVIRYSDADGQYIVNWHTDQCIEGACQLDDSKTYRVRVLAGATELGHADIRVFQNAGQMKNLVTDAYFGLVNGRTVPLKFRIEEGAVTALPPGGSASVGPSGGVLVAAGQEASLEIPSGALASNVAISMVPATDFPEGPGAWAPPMKFGPEGTTFTTPVKLSLRFDPELVPDGVELADLGMYHFDGTGWVPIESTVEEDLGLVTGEISHFSIYSIMIRPNTITGEPTPRTIPVGGQTILSGFSQGYEQRSLTTCKKFLFFKVSCKTTTSLFYYPSRSAVYWSTSNSASVGVFAGPTYPNARGEFSSPPIIGRAPGTGAVTAKTCEDRIFALPSCKTSNAVTITVWGPELTVISSGGSHACGLTNAGKAFCWGDGATGQLGHGGRAGSLVPVPVSGNLAFVMISAGSSHTCALTAGGEAYCWGAGLGGALGDGLRRDQSVPSRVAGGYVFSTISAGELHTCAVTQTGAGMCWGRGDNGRVGNGRLESHAETSPVPVNGNHMFSTIAAGGSHTCGVTRTGDAMCWGTNRRGQLGIEVAGDFSSPVLVAGGHRFISVVTGREHSCGLSTVGSALCWGFNNNGQNGNGTIGDHREPIPVSGGVSFVKITSADYSTCALTPARTAYCWGHGQGGELGIGAFEDRGVPSAVSGGQAFAAIEGGGLFTCGITTSGSALCWGANTAGQLGTGTATASASPVQALFSRNTGAVAVDPPLFNESFTEITSPNIGSQCGTGKRVYAFSTFAGWTATGGHWAHGVEYAPGRIAATFIDQGEQVLNGSVEANQQGTAYRVDFLAGPTVWEICGQATAPGDGVIIDVLRQDNTVLASITHHPAAWSTTEPLSPAGFTYVGDGTGPIRLRFRDNLVNERFGGAVTDLRIRRVFSP